MSENKRSVLGAPRKIRALLSSFIRYGGSDGNKSVSDDSGDKSCQDTPDAPSPVSKGDTDGPNPQATPRTARRSFRPLSREDFFNRVDTFKIYSWFAKPPSLSPLQCARYGWENIDLDTLKCVSCKEIVTAGLPPQWETEKYEAACKAAEETLRSAHSKICPWHTASSPESFLDLELTDEKEVAEAYCSRVTSLNELGSRLPNLDLSSIKNDSFDPDTKWKTLQGLVRGNRLWSKIGDQEGSAEEEEQIWKTSCLLALFGWQKSSSDISSMCPMLVCQKCRRRAGVWNFLAIEENQADSTTADVEDDHRDCDEPQTKRIKRDNKKTPFNPVEEHRSWCVWVQPSTNHSSLEPFSIDSSPSTPTKDKSHELGWQRSLAILLKRADPDSMLDKSTTPPNQAWKTVRKIMTFWKSSHVEEATEAMEDDKTAGSE